jgi:hypothetical protein
MTQDKLKLLYNKMFTQPAQIEAVVEDTISQPVEVEAVVEDIISQPKAKLKSNEYCTYRPTIEEFDRLFGDNL